MTKGTITQVSGSVVDVRFAPGQLPKIREALAVTVDGRRRVMEVAQHIGGGRVRCGSGSGAEIRMNTTSGGMEIKRRDI